MKLTCILVLAVSATLCAFGQMSQQATPAAQTVSPAAVNPTPAPSSQADPKDAIKERVTAYYSALIGGDKKTAEQLLTPESRIEFEQSDFRALASFAIEQIAVDPSGSKAEVTVTRSFGGPYAMTIPWHEQWVNTDGQWFLKFPENTHETPFGKIMPGNATNPGNSANTTKDEQEMMKRMAERRMRTADPDQYIKQVDKYVREHPDALPPTEVQVPVPQQQASPSKPASDVKAATANTSAQATTSDSKKDKKSKKKSSKKSDPSGADEAKPKS